METYIYMLHCFFIIIQHYYNIAKLLRLVPRNPLSYNRLETNEKSINQVYKQQVQYNSYFIKSINFKLQNSKYIVIVFFRNV